MMYDECYRGYGRFRELLFHLYESGPYCCDAVVGSFCNYLSMWLDDNRYELRKFEIAGEDIEELQKNVTVPLGRGESAQKELDEIHAARLNMAELFIPPAKKIDRCPEDILKEEIEK